MVRLRWPSIGFSARPRPRQSEGEVQDEVFAVPAAYWEAFVPGWKLIAFDAAGKVVWKWNAPWAGTPNTVLVCESEISMGN